MLRALLVVALSPGHDGAAVAVKDGKLLFSLEAEKDSFQRHAQLNPSTILSTAEHLGELPDVVAYAGGWRDQILGDTREGAGYLGPNVTVERRMNYYGKWATLIETTHERAHIIGAIGMAPRDGAGQRAALVWEGGIGSLYLVDDGWRVTKEVPVLDGPGVRYASLFALADPSFPDVGGFPRNDDSGKLMALAAFGDAATTDRAIIDAVGRIVTGPAPWPFRKHDFRDSPLHNAGVEATIVKDAAALLSERIFQMFATAAQEQLPAGLPLYIAGGCGLNCDWNTMWRELGHFSSVFVPPCANDSGMSIGAAADALAALTGDPYMEWSVYSGLEFEWDTPPDPQKWRRREFSLPTIADTLGYGMVFAWVQGRAEIGPRALGNRSLLANPFDEGTRDRLNEIKQREGYRPIAPCVRIEDVGKVYDRDFEDPYMLYFRRATTQDLGAVTHVDGSARCQTVSRESNRPLHDLLTVFGERHGVGVLCNTSLNFKRKGFINRMSDLTRYCETRGVRNIVVGDAWFQRYKPDPD